MASTSHLRVVSTISTMFVQAAIVNATMIENQHLVVLFKVDHIQIWAKRETYCTLVCRQPSHEPVQIIFGLLRR
jgi:hypothetical protein